MTIDMDAIENAEASTDAETDRYEKAYRETRRVLDETIELLMILEDAQEDTAMRDQIALKRLEQETSRSNLAAANIAFHTGKATMRPPSPALVSDILALSKQAVELTAEKTTAAAAVKLATSALKKFAEIQDI